MRLIGRFYYWTILDSLLASSSDASDYVDLVAVETAEWREA